MKRFDSMKRFLTMCSVLCLLVSTVGCEQYDKQVDKAGVNPSDNSEEANTESFVSRNYQLEYSSIEDFLDSYRAAITGDIDGDFSAMVEDFDFTTLRSLYLPVSIPIEYELHSITVNAGMINFWYFHEDDLVSESDIHNAEYEKQYFQFSIFRLELDSPMEGILRQENATEADLMHGKYLFVEPNCFLWAEGRNLLCLYTPIPLENFGRLGLDSSAYGASMYTTQSGITPTDPYIVGELVQFTEVGVIDLGLHLVDYMFVYDYTTITPEVTYNELTKTLTLNSVEFSAIGVFPDTVFIEVNKVAASNVQTCICSDTITLDATGVGTYSLTSPVAISTADEHLEIIVYTDSSRVEEVSRLHVKPVVF